MPWSSWVVVVSLLALPLGAVIVLVSRVWHAYARRTGLVKGTARRIERPWVWRTAAGMLVAMTATTLYARYVEPDWVQTTRTEIAVPRPVCGKPRFRIVHLSDLHLDRFGAREKSVVEAVRAATPHLIVLTGDYIGSRAAEEDFVAFLRELKAPLGVVGIGGHWDAKWPVPDLFARAGARYLRDDYLRIDGDSGAPLLIVGHDIHPGRTLAELLEGASEDVYRLYLSHSPDSVGELARARADLFLCGHTHGGQVRLPFYGAIATMTQSGKRYEQGLYLLKAPVTANSAGTAMYVNRGIGTFPAVPLRLLARPEVAVLELVARR